MSGAPSRGTVICAGLCNIDYVVSVAAIPKEPIKFRAHDWREVGGGLAATAAVAVARLGGRAVFCGRVGDDTVGQQIRAGLAAEGVDTAWLRTMPGRSPRAMVLVDGKGERLLATYADPSLPTDAGWLDPQLQGAVLVDITWPAGAVRVLDAARHARVPSVVDADSTTRTSAADIHEILQRASHLIFSRTGLLQHAGTGEVDPGLRTMQAKYGAYVGVTDGEHGYHWLEGETLRQLPAPRIAAVDTNGAGDAFHGAFALALARGEDELAAARFAILVATLKCTKPGSREGLPTAAEVTAFAAVQTTLSPSS